MRLFIVAVALAATLSGCATPYQSNGLRGGYSDLQLDKNVFRVSFQGNAYTKPRAVGDFLLLRSAELTLEKGFKYFQIAGSSNESTSAGMPLPATATTTVYGNQANTVVSGGGFLNLNFPAGSQVIICYSERPEAYAFDADLLLRSLGQAYGRSFYTKADTPKSAEVKPSDQRPAECDVRVISAGGKPIPKEEQCPR